ncbi:MAG: phage head morphogenesis protein [Bacteroidales bacterium]|nr:phage head morphogenesis protein [Bacteroidales bacterium]
MTRRISKAERRHQDALRLASLKVAGVYQSRLQKFRRKELRRVLALCRNYDDPSAIATMLEAELSETGYLPGWWTGLWITAGVPVAKTTAAGLREAKASAEEDTWIATLRYYATERAGREIVSVTGTWKKTLIGLLADILTEDIGNMGIEKVTKELYRRYVGDIERWQCRRIAQTETMIGAADAGDLAAQELDIDYTKTWSISGLGNTRETHEMMDGVTVDRDELFQLPDCMMRYPHDTRFNPPAGEIINCACSCIRRPK